MWSSEFINTLLASFGGSIVAVGALAAWLGNVWRDRIARTEALLSQIDVDLRTRRIDVYKELWEKTALLPNWPRDESVTYEQLLNFSYDLTDWYFHRGGMYLSGTAQSDGYAALQDTLAQILQDGPTGRLSLEAPDHYGMVRDRCSTLRTLLAIDIESRREAPSKSRL